MTEKKVKTEATEKPKKWLSTGGWIWGALAFMLWMQVVLVTPTPGYLFTRMPELPGWVLWGTLAIIATSHFYWRYTADFLCQKLSYNK